jgi:hypothetical protein|tara:strand:+ start:4070 stop:4582 length:513 start_codon:yes stop_codon:yes gene_type:complete
MVSWNPFATKEPTSSFDAGKWSGFLDQTKDAFFGREDDTAAQQFLSDQIAANSGSGASNQNAVFGPGGFSEGPNGSRLWSDPIFAVNNQADGGTGGPGGMGVEPDKPNIIEKALGLASTGLSLFGAAKGAGLFGLCDIRLKEDIAPLEQTDINDDLAEIAFFIKDLRESN